MKRLIVLILLSIFILSGCSQGDGNEVKLQEEISVLKAENQRLKEENNALKVNNGVEVLAEETSELSINEGIYSIKQYDKDVTIEYFVKGYGFQETIDSDVGNFHFPINRTTEGKFLILEIFVENIGKEEDSISKYQLIIDDKGREYRCEGVFNKDKEMATNWTIKPGFSTTLYAIFEVPSELKVDKHVYNEFSDSVIKLDLNQLEEHRFDL